jgi:cation:H+ antiporter
VLALIVIIATSFGAVNCAVWLGQHWGVDEAITGMLLLAVLTSLPNVVAAVKLATDGLGPAVISESLNSNSLNIIAGIAVPSLVIGFAAPQPSIVYAAIWLFVMKCVTLFAASRANGLSRAGGVVIILLYVMFAVAVFVYA